MEKHIQLVGILNIVYRSFILFISVAICLLIAWITRAIQLEVCHNGDVPLEFLNVIPLILCTFAAVLFIVSLLGILGGIGVLKRKEWGRIITLIVSILNLIHIPIGTALGVYSLWVLMNDETIKMFNPTAGGQITQPKI